MSSRRFLGIAGAAMMGSLVGSNAAHAVFGLDDDLNVSGRVVVAKETLLNEDANNGVIRQREGTVVREYHVLNILQTGSGTYDLRIPMPVGIAASTSNSVVTVTLENMVIARAIGTDQYGVVTAAGDTSDGEANSGDLVANTAMSIDGGGAIGDSRIRFDLDVGTTAVVRNTHELFVSFRRLAILPDTAGTITVTVALPGDTEGTSTVLDNVVRMRDMIDVSYAATDQVASAQHSFTRFSANPGSVSADQLRASMGRVTIGVVAATSGVTHVTQSGAAVTGSNLLKSGNVVAFSGTTGPAETGFLRTEDAAVYVSDRQDCGTGTVTTIVTAAEDGTVSMKVPVSSVDGDGGYLCLKVDGETRIPTTGPYSVSIMDAALENAAFPATIEGAELGSISHGGAVAQIPYVTTNARYNQRIVIVNRNSAAVTYAITFNPADGTSADATADANGTVGANSRKILQVRDLVSLDVSEGGGENTAATVTLTGGSPGNIEVATLNTTASDGSTDTVLYEVE